MKDRIDFYQDIHGGWRWRIVAANNEVVAASSESFASKWNAKRNFKRAMKGMA